MTARKVAVAVLFAGIVLYLAVTWAIDWFKRERLEDEPVEPEPVRLAEGRLLATADRPAGVAAECAPWTVAVASPDVGRGRRVAVGELGPEAAALSIRERGDVVACDVRVVDTRDDLPPRTVAVYAGEKGTEFALERLELLLYPVEE